MPVVNMIKPQLSNHVRQLESIIQKLNVLVIQYEEYSGMIGDEDTQDIVKYLKSTDKACDQIVEIARNLQKSLASYRFN